MASLLEQLSKMTVVVADTGDLEAIKTFRPRDATTNPSLILAAAQIPAYQNLIDHSLISSRKRVGSFASTQEVIDEIQNSLEETNKNYQPAMRFQNFGDSSINLMVYFRGNRY